MLRGKATASVWRKKRRRFVEGARGHSGDFGYGRMWLGEGSQGVGRRHCCCCWCGGGRNFGGNAQRFRGKGAVFASSCQISNLKLV